MPVDFRKVLSDSSRKLADIAASMVLEEPERISALTDVILADEDPFASRAARVFSICADKFPEIFEMQQNTLIPYLHDINSEGVIRNILKIVADYPVKLTKRNKGILLGLCFDWLEDLTKPVAIRVHAMQILYNTSLYETGIRDELISILEENYADGSMGFRSRTNKILKKLYKNG
ncbi:MAG: hypothetical protein JW973_02790 [Bacteroidales bacterium]|nr:hypothetical protein [Bacteroidales bacterium]